MERVFHGKMLVGQNQNVLRERANSDEFHLEKIKASGFGKVKLSMLIFSLRYMMHHNRKFKR